MITYQPLRPQRQCIVIPQQLQFPAVQWTHSLLGHVGVNRLTDTLSSRFWFPNMKLMIEQAIKKCSFYQRNKIVHKQYTYLPPKSIQHLTPWDEVHVDMIKPWKIVINKLEYQFRAVTCIDAVIGLPEVIPVEDEKSSTVANDFENNWLSQYPRPRHCVHDNGNEFLGHEFGQMLTRNNIQAVPTTVKNPQSNALSIANVRYLQENCPLVDTCCAPFQASRLKSTPRY